jgi:hypothetical protein
MIDSVSHGPGPDPTVHAQPEPEPQAQSRHRHGLSGRNLKPRRAIFLWAKPWAYVTVRVTARLSPDAGGPSRRRWQADSASPRPSPAGPPLPG